MTVQEIIARLDNGELRIAEKKGEEWIINTILKQAILDFFPLNEIAYSESGVMKFRDKLPLKTNFDEARIVPGGTSVRYGAYLGKQVVVMPPAYINIGAYIDDGSMVDSNVLVGSCAQIGKNVHLSAGVQIGGVLEPLQASPTIIEDNVFVGLGSNIAEGVIIQEGAVIASGVTIIASTPIIELDEEGNKINEFRGVVPKNAVVIPGTRRIGSGDFYVQTPIIRKYRDESTDSKTALNLALRDF